MAEYLNVERKETAHPERGAVFHLWVFYRHCLLCGLPSYEILSFVL